MRKKILFVLLSLCALLSNPFINASEHSSQLDSIRSEIENGKMTDEKKELISANINYLEGRLLKKIKRYEERLENFKSNLNNSQDGTEVQQGLKKIGSAERKIKNLNEIYYGIELLKLKLSN